MLSLALSRKLAGKLSFQRPDEHRRLMTVRDSLTRDNRYDCVRVRRIDRRGHTSYSRDDC